MSIPALNRSPDPLLLVHGPFGAAVGSYLKRRLSVECHSLADEPSSAKLAGSLRGRSVALACSHWPQVELEMLDVLAREQGARWIAAFLHDHQLFVLRGGGTPGRPCARCIWRRFLVHAPLAKVEQARQEQLRTRGGTGPRGFPPGAAGLAAVQLRNGLQPTSDARAPEVTRVDLLSGNWQGATVVPLHGCTLCRPASAEKSRRFVKHLSAALEPERVATETEPTTMPAEWRVSA